MTASANAVPAPAEQVGHHVFHDGPGGRYSLAVPEGPAGPLLSRTLAPPRLPGQPQHVHPRQDKTLDVVSGMFEVRLDGTWTRVVAGGSVRVPAGVPHAVRNPTDEWTEVHGRLEPAGDWLRFWAVFCALDRGRKGPLFGLRMARLVAGHAEDIAFSGPLGTVVAGLGRAATSMGVSLPDADELVRLAQRPPSAAGS